MKLTELDAQLHRYEERMDADPRINGGAPGLRRFLVPVPDLAQAQGVWFLCPGCYQKNGGPVGTHMVEITFRDRGVPDHLGSHNRAGQPSRWAASGSGLHDLVLSPSVDCGCWHGFVGSSGVPPGEAR
jgi:hypothetical protein